MMMLPVAVVGFRGVLWAAQSISQRIAESTTPAREVSGEGSFFLSDDRLSGFHISSDGELTGLFSLVSGRGADLVREALNNGANHLDCFDGFLPKFYSQFGFKEIRRETNWTAGGPDVVYMAV